MLTFQKKSGIGTILPKLYVLSEQGGKLSRNS